MIENMVRSSWLLLLVMAWGASARADTPRFEELAPPAKGQALVDLSGTLKQETIQEVNGIAADLAERDQGRLVIVAVDQFDGELNAPAATLYDAWDVGGTRDDGAVIFLPLKSTQAGLALGDALYEFTSRQGPLDSFRGRIARMGEDRDGAIVGAARDMAALMAEAAPQRKPRPPTTSPFAAFRRPHSGVADPDRLLTAELVRKAKAQSYQVSAEYGDGGPIFVVYDQSRHPMAARALAESLNTAWKIDGDFWLVVVSTHPAEAWLLPTRNFGRNGGHRAGIPVAVEEWKRAAEELGREPEGPQTQAAWAGALDATTTLARLGELNVPGQEQQPRVPLSAFLFEHLKPFALAVGLFLVGLRLSRLRPGRGPASLRWFLVTGLGWTLVYGLSSAWVRTSFPIGAIFMAFWGTPVVFGGVRGLAGYFGFERDGYRSSACALAALGMLWSMMFFSSRVLEVGVTTRSIDVRELPGTHAGAFLLQGAWVKDEFSAVNDRSREIRWLAPLVFEGWTPEQPVPAWLACPYDEQSSSESCNRGELVRNAIAPSGLGPLEQGRLVAEAERITALHSVPGAKLLAWSEDATSEVRKAVTLGLLPPLALLAAFVAVAVYGRRWEDPTGDRS